ncbi:uncharacterized protein LOC143196239 [Rhynchophorus ferrugineus]|uniref:uncharacterized protein LOC143196239 n=1 Tax=Rhynchophorus ferrugineus TaxID=354439 RepID=UPI003FCC5309
MEILRRSIIIIFLIFVYVKCDESSAKRDGGVLKQIARLRRQNYNYSTIRSEYENHGSNDWSRANSWDRGANKYMHSSRSTSNVDDATKKSYQTYKKPVKEYAGPSERYYPQTRRQYYASPQYQSQYNPVKTYRKSYTSSLRAIPERYDVQNTNNYVKFPANEAQQYYRANQSIRRQFQNVRPTQTTTTRPTRARLISKKKFRPQPVFP